MVKQPFDGGRIDVDGVQKGPVVVVAKFRSVEA